MSVGNENERSWLTLRDFIHRYSTSRTQAWREMAAGRLIAHKLGKRVLISQENADRWAAKFPVFVSRAKGAAKPQNIRASLPSTE